MLTDTPLCVADVLERAADLIEPEGAWTQGCTARRENGHPLTFATSEAARCWCIAGSVERIAKGRIASEALDLVSEVVGDDVIDWNDASSRTQPEVVAALRRAATLARAGDA